MSSVAKHKLNHFYRFFLPFISWFLHIRHSYLVLSRDDSFTFFISLIISSSSGSSINKSLSYIASSSWWMSITSFTAFYISSLGFSYFSPVSFLKCAWTSRLLLLFLLFSCVPSFIAFSGHRTLLLYFPRCSLPRTPLSAIPTTSVTTLADSSSVCSLLLSAFLLPAKLLPLIPRLLLSFSLMLCSISTFSLLSLAASGWFHSLFSWTIALCCSLPSCKLPLPHLLAYLPSGPSWISSLSSYPFWCVSPGRHVL